MRIHVVKPDLLSAPLRSGTLDSGPLRSGLPNLENRNVTASSLGLLNADLLSAGVPREEQEQTRTLDLTGKHVVIVEDEGITQLQLKRILRAQGLHIAGVAANGKDAVAIVLEKRPDLVLMDIHMPVMDGIEASRRILETNRICIVVLSAYSEEEYQEQARRLGVCGYVLKPITAETLMPQIRAAYEKFVGS